MTPKQTALAVALLLLAILIFYLYAAKEDKQHAVEPVQVSWCLPVEGIHGS